MPISTVEEVQLAVDALENLEEGFVVVDKDHNRVKIKSPAYVKAHHIRGEGLNLKRASELVAMNEHEEYISVFPEDASFFEPIIVAEERLLREIMITYDHVEFLESQKDFAIAVKDLDYSAILFIMRRTGANAYHVWIEAKMNYKVDLIMKRIAK
jgi:hypothetical protein